MTEEFGTRHQSPEFSQAENITINLTQIHELITATLQIHLNLGQSLSINASSVFFTMETTPIQSLADRRLNEQGEAAIHFPTADFTISQNTTDRLYIRVSLSFSFLNRHQCFFIVQLIVQPLTSMENSSEEMHTKFSQMLELSLIDPNGTEVKINASEADPIELFIPRDAQAVKSALKWTDVSPENKTNRTNDYHRVNITKDPNVTVAMQFEVHPVNHSAAYFLIYRFNDFPSLFPMAEPNDGQELLCPES